MSAFVLPVIGFLVFALLPRAWWSVGVSFVACTFGILFSSVLDNAILENATMHPFWLANGAFAAGLYHLVRRAMSPNATRFQILRATLGVFALFGLTFWLILTLIGS